MLDTVNLTIDEITTEILRNYLADYKSNSNAGMVTIDNIRRTLSSFFAWLENIRDLAILELLISNGMRVGELTRLNISDMNFQERSCIVLGKGNSERKVYFSEKSKMYIKKYLKQELIII